MSASTSPPDTTAPPTTPTESSSSPSSSSFLPPLPSSSFLLSNNPSLSSSLRSWVFHHTLNHSRPLVLISSGGTAADLEHRVVRTLENFSTGYRGATLVEQFLRQGYAVLHLHRTGSVAPYARILQREARKQGQQDNSNNNYYKTPIDGSVTTEEFESMFQLPEESSQSEMDNNPTLQLNPQFVQQLSSSNNNNNSLSSSSSSSLVSALHELRRVRREDRLRVIPFRTVEEYLHQLHHCAQLLQPVQSMALFVLAAAVSDYYFPHKSPHKLQSATTTNATAASSHNDSTPALTLELYPVPKILGHLKQPPSAAAGSDSCPSQPFLCAFKLETDHALLRHKSERAVQLYSVDMVIGNLLHTRHDEVFILHSGGEGDNDENDKNGSNKTAAKKSVQDWPVTHLQKTPRREDSLEAALAEFCIQQHFQHISKHPAGFNDDTGILLFRQRLEEERVRAARRRFWKHAKETVWQLGGTLLGSFLTYTITSAIQRRILQAGRE